MAKLALYNTTSGALAGFYDTVDSPPPGTLPFGTATLSITDTQWQQCVTNPSAYLVSSGVLTGPVSSTLLTQAQNSKISLLNNSYRAAVSGLFSSNALGSFNIYAVDPTSLSYLMAAVSASLLPGLSGGWTTPIWTEVSSTWAFVNHTAAQVQQVLTDFMTAQHTAQTHLNTLVASVNAATTTGQVAAISW